MWRLKAGASTDGADDVCLVGVKLLWRLREQISSWALAIILLSSLSPSPEHHNYANDFSSCINSLVFCSLSWQSTGLCSKNSYIIFQENSSRTMSELW